MALSTASRSGGSDILMLCNLKVNVMALQAQERLGLGQKIVHDRAVRIVALIAAFHDRGMFELERTLLVGMALEAEVIGIGAGL